MNNKTDNSTGIAIKCPHCEATLTVYHLDWSAIICLECKGEIANPETNDTVTHVEMWYSNTVRLWVIQRLNSMGYQVGDADYAFNKPQVIEHCEGNYETVPIHLFKNGTELVKIYNPSN